MPDVIVFDESDIPALRELSAALERLSESIRNSRETEKDAVRLMKKWEDERQGRKSSFYMNSQS